MAPQPAGAQQAGAAGAQQLAGVQQPLDLPQQRRVLLQQPWFEPQQPVDLPQQPWDLPQHPVDLPQQVRAGAQQVGCGAQHAGAAGAQQAGAVAAGAQQDGAELQQELQPRRANASLPQNTVASNATLNATQFLMSDPSTVVKRKTTPLEGTTRGLPAPAVTLVWRHSC